MCIGYHLRLRHNKWLYLVHSIRKISCKDTHCSLALVIELAINTRHPSLGQGILTDDLLQQYFVMKILDRRDIHISTINSYVT